MNKQVTDYINNSPEEQKIIMERIREIIHKSVPDVLEEFKWSRPVFTLKKDFAYLKTAKAYVTLGFFNSNNIKEETYLLEGTGKDMRHIKIKKVEEINSKLLDKWFKVLTRD